MSGFSKFIDLFFKQMDYDPSIDLYRARARAIAAKSKGVEQLAYLIFGANNIAAWAYSLDPYRKFRMTQLGKVAPATRYRQWVAIGKSPRSFHRTQVNRTTDDTQSSIPGQSGSFTSEKTVDDTKSALPAQNTIMGFIRDTSRRTRSSDQTQGEFELYAPRFKGSASEYSYTGNTNETYYGGVGYHEQVRYHENIRYGYSSPSIYLDVANHNMFLASLQSEALDILTKNTPSLVAQCLPNRQRYEGLYQLLELRELPSLLRETTKFYKSKLTDLSIREGSNAYLAYKFGWESTWQAITQLLHVVPNVNKEINYLIKRNGHATTFHRGYTLSDRISSVPLFSTDVSPHDELIDAAVTSNSSTHAYIRVTVNVNIDMPRLAVPSIRKEMFIRKLGLGIPTPAMALDFVPWTWLVDYFGSGLEYLKILDSINGDSSVINYGLSSLRVIGHVVPIFYGRTTVIHTTTIEPPPVTTSETAYRSASRTATFDYKYHIRKSISGLADVKILSDRTNLSPYQTSIITALAGKYSPHTK